MGMRGVGSPLTGASSEGLGNTSGQTPALCVAGEPGHPPHGQLSQTWWGNPAGGQGLGGPILYLATFCTPVKAASTQPQLKVLRHLRLLLPLPCPLHQAMPTMPS